MMQQQTQHLIFFHDTELAIAKERLEIVKSENTQLQDEKMKKLCRDHELMRKMIEQNTKLQDEKENLVQENEVLHKVLENVQDQETDNENNDQSLLIGALTKLKGFFSARFCISLVLLYSMILPVQKLKSYQTFSEIPPLEYFLTIVQVATFLALFMVQFAESWEFMKFFDLLPMA